MQRIRIVMLHVVAIVLPALPDRSALAWGPDGHRIVGAIAQAHLSAKARAGVADLLAGEAEPSLAGVANWADQIRLEGAWKYTSPWHYVNLPDLECRYQASRDCPDGNCVIGAIERQTQILADRNAPRQQRVEALKFVAHFVGDVHQPLHAGLRADRGGNDFAIRFRGEDWNLHSVWDSLILRDRLARDGGWSSIARLLAATAPQDDAAGSPEVWAEESCQLIRSAHAYPGKHRIRDTYLRKQLPIVEDRLQLAGIRLSVLLNSVLAAP